jgi:hypothetical protein
MRKSRSVGLAIDRAGLWRVGELGQAAHDDQLERASERGMKEKIHAAAAGRQAGGAEGRHRRRDVRCAPQAVRSSRFKLVVQKLFDWCESRRKSAKR